MLARVAVSVLGFFFVVFFLVGFACGVCSPKVCQCRCEVHRWMLVNSADKDNTVLNSCCFVSSCLQGPHQNDLFFFFHSMSILRRDFLEIWSESRPSLTAYTCSWRHVFRTFLVFKDVTAQADPLRLQAQTKTALPVLQKKKKKGSEAVLPVSLP